MKITILAAISLVFISATPKTAPKASKQEFYSLKVYLLKDKDQQTRVENYLKNALLPALHRAGFPRIGVFEPIGNDTAAIRKIYVFIPGKSLDELTTLQTKLDKDPQYAEQGKDYIEAAYDKQPYIRIENILLKAFPDMPRHAAPQTLQGPKSDRIYELRSYEGPTEKYYDSKVRMFNEGGEIPLFQRLGFNAIFYASVVSGSHMPNLMYMTTFDDMPAREQHWKNFFSDSVWKQLVAKPEYQHNVSHSDIIFLHPTEWSDL